MPDNIMIGVDLQLKIIDYDHVKEVHYEISKDFGTQGYVRYQLQSFELDLRKLNEKNKKLKPNYSTKEEDYFALGMTVFLLMLAPRQTDAVKLIDKLNSSTSFNAYCRESSYEQWLDRLKQVYSDYWSSDRPAATQLTQQEVQILEVLAALFDYSPTRDEFLQTAREWTKQEAPQSLIDEMHAAVIPYIIGAKLKDFKDKLISDFEKKRDALIDAVRSILSIVDLKYLEKWFCNLPDDFSLSDEWSIEQMIYFVVRTLISKVECRIKSIVLQMTTPDDNVFLKVDTTIGFKGDQKIEVALKEKILLPEVVKSTVDQQDNLISDLEETHGKELIDALQLKTTEDDFTSIPFSKTGKYGNGIQVVKDTYEDISHLYDVVYEMADNRVQASQNKDAQPQSDPNCDSIRNFCSSLPKLMMQIRDMLSLLHDKLSMHITIDEHKTTEHLKNYKINSTRRFVDGFMELLKTNEKIISSPINCNTLQRFADSCLEIDIKHQSDELAVKCKALESSCKSGK